MESRFRVSRSRSGGLKLAFSAETRRVRPILLLLLACLVSSCAGLGDDVFGSSRGRPSSQFSGVRVLQNERTLSKPGEASHQACPPVSERLISPLRAMGASIQKPPPPNSQEGRGSAAAAPDAATVAILKGASSDPILLIAPYTDDACADPHPDSMGLGSAAFLLELGRVLSAHPLSYSVWLIFVPESADPARSDSPEPTPWPALTQVVSRFEKSGVLERVRVAVFFEGLGLPNSAALRDSHSHPIYREVFWESARDLGLTDLFPEDAAFASSALGHHALINEGLRRTVLVSTAGAFDKGEAPARGDSRAQAKAFQSAGDVSLEAIGRIQTRLERIERLSGPSEQG